MDSLHASVRGAEQEVGDTADILGEYNLVNLSKGGMRALGPITPLALLAADVKELQAKVDKLLLALIQVVDEDHQKASKFLMGKLRAIPT